MYPSDRKHTHLPKQRHNNYVLAEPVTGFMTMTCDLMHEGHINILRTAKSMCKYLIIGLTTDELARRQKRETFFTFHHRALLLRSCRYVDSVVEHSGNTKQTDYERLKFDILFTGDDYAFSPEYKDFEFEYPHVKVVYLPRTSSVSTSNIINNFMTRCIGNMHVSPYGMMDEGIIMTAACDAPVPRIIECYLYNSKSSNMDTIHHKEIQRIGIEQLVMMTPDPFSHLVLKLYTIDRALGQSRRAYVTPAVYINGGNWSPYNPDPIDKKNAFTKTSNDNESTRGNVVCIWRFSKTERLPISLIDLLRQIETEKHRQVLDVVRECIMDYSQKGFVHHYLKPEHIRYTQPPNIQQPNICGWENAQRTSDRYTSVDDHPDWIQLQQCLNKPSNVNTEPEA